MAEDKIYTDPVEILAALREGAKKMIADHLEKAKKLEKGDTSPIPPDDVGMPQPTLAKVAIKLDNNKNSGLPRGNYTGKTSIMKPESAPKPLAPPKALSAPKPPQAPMPPKPPMAKGEVFGINQHLGPNDTPETHDLVHHVVDRQTGRKIGTFKNKTQARNVVNKKDNEFGGYRHELVSEKVPKMAKGELEKHAADGDDGTILTNSTKHISKESADKFADALKSGKIHHAKEQTAQAPSKQPDRIDRIMGDMRAARVAPKATPKPVAEPKSKMRMEHGLELDKAEGNPQKLKKEHSGFEKLEGKLAHEKGITNPKALAAKIGMEKYGKKGMEEKAESAKKSESLAKDETTKNMRPPKVTGTEKTVISKPPATKKPSPLENFGNGLKQGADQTIVDKTVSMRKHEVASEQKNPIKEMKEAVKEMKSNVEKLPVKEKKTQLKKDEVHIHMGGKDKASKMMTSQALDQAHKDVKQTAMVPDKAIKLPNQKEQAVRAQQYASMTPKGHFDDDILGSCGYCGKSEHDGMC